VGQSVLFTHSIDLYMLSMLHTTFWSVSELQQHDAVLPDIV